MKEGERSLDIFQLVGKIIINSKDAEVSIDRTAGRAKNAEGIMTKAFKAVGSAVATYLSVSAIKNFGQACIDAAANAQAMEAQFTQVFSGVEETASASLTSIANNAGISENRLKGSYTKIAAFAKTTGMETADAMSLADRAMIAVADSAAFYDRSLESVTESLQSFLKGNYENDAALGLSCTEITRNAAATELWGKKFQQLSEEQKQLTLLKMVEDANELSGAMGQAARESDTWANQTGNLKQAWTDFKAEIGEHILPTVIDLVKKFSGLVEMATEKVDPAIEFLTGKFQMLKVWLSEVGSYAAETFQPVFDNLSATFSAVQEAIQPFVDKLSEYVSSGEAATDATNFLKDAIDGVAAVAEFVADKLAAFSNWCIENPDEIEAVATIILSFAAAWALVNGVIMPIAGLVSGVGAAIAFLSSPIGIAVAAIGLIIAAVVAVVTHWDQMKAACAELGQNLANGFQMMCQNVVDNFNKMKEEASAKWQAFKETVGSIASDLASKAVDKFNEMKSNAVGKISEMHASVTGKFAEIQSGIQEKIESARDSVKNAIEKIKSFFDFSWELPALKMPHFTISGSFSLNPPSVPSFGISWYKKAYENAMILNDPTIFGFSAASGKMLGGGEGNGNEVVAGEAHLMNMIREAVATQIESLAFYLQEQNDMLADYFPQVIEAAGHDIVTNDGAIVARYAPMFNTALGKISRGKDRGR